MGFLNPTSGWSTLSCSLGGKLLSGSLSSRGFAGSLLCTGHFFSLEKKCGVKLNCTNGFSTINLHMSKDYLSLISKSTMAANCLAGKVISSTCVMHCNGFKASWHVPLEWRQGIPYAAHEYCIYVVQLYSESPREAKWRFPIFAQHSKFSQFNTNFRLYLTRGRIRRFGADSLYKYSYTAERPYQNGGHKQSKCRELGHSVNDGKHGELTVYTLSEVICCRQFVGVYAL